MEHDFSSWSREQEASFVVYERKTSESSRAALTIGAIAGGIFFFLVIAIYAGVEPKDEKIKDINMSNLTKRTEDNTAKPEAPKPDPAKAEAPKTDTPKTDTPKTDDKAPAEKPAADGTK